MNKTIKIIAFVLITGILMSGCSDLKIDYEFASGQSFTDIQGTFSDKASTSYKGYMYYFNVCLADSDLPWNTATLHSPALINGGNDIQQCWMQEDGWSRNLNFYCGGSATTPVKPPEGTYQVNVSTKTYTLDDVTSRLIGSDLNNVYVPEIKLTMDSSGKISQINWQWWKKVAGNWIQPSNTDLANALEDVGFSTSQAGWVGDRVYGDIALTTTGQVIPPTQNFTPGVFRVNFADSAGYSYGFEWR